MADPVSPPPADDQAASEHEAERIARMTKEQLVTAGTLLMARNEVLSARLRGMARRVGHHRRWASRAVEQRAVARRQATNLLKALGGAAGVRRAGYEGSGAHEANAQAVIAAALRQRADLAELRSMMAERTAAVGDAANRYMAERARVAAVRALADDLPDLLQAYAWSHQDGTWLGYAEFIAGRIRAVLDGDAEAPADGWWTAHRLDVWECDEDDWRWRCSCGTGGFVYVTEQLAQAAADAHAAEPVSVGPAEAAEPAYVHDENCCPDCFNGLATHAKPFEECPCAMAGVGEPGVDRYPRAGSVTTTPAAPEWETDETRTEWAVRSTGANGFVAVGARVSEDMARSWAREFVSHHADIVAAEPVSRLVQHRESAWTASPVAPALIGTWADEAFVAHQDHKHPVDGCGYCPSEEDR